MDVTGTLDPRLWIVIAAFNEAGSIGPVVAQLRAGQPHVVVVDDGSRDRTGDEALAAGAVVVRHPMNLGQGAALQTGIDFALAQGADWIVTFDADGQHAAADIPVLQGVQRATGAEVVLGSRFLGRTIGMPAGKRALLKAAVVFTRWTTGLRLTDAHNGLRLLGRDAAARIRLRQNRMAHASEILSQVARLGLRHAEAPVTVAYTAYSMRKGQRLSNSVNILTELVLGRLAH